MSKVDRSNWRPKVAPMTRSSDPHEGNPMPIETLKRPGVPNWPAKTRSKGMKRR